MKSEIETLQTELVATGDARDYWKKSHALVEKLLSEEQQKNTLLRERVALLERLLVENGLVWWTCARCGVRYSTLPTAGDVCGITLFPTGSCGGKLNRRGVLPSEGPSPASDKALLCNRCARVGCKGCSGERDDSPAKEAP